MNLPNLISMLRLLLVPCFFLAVYYTLSGKEPLIWVARIILVLTVVSDFMDGYLARTWGEITPLGKFLDPLADKLFVTCTFILLAVFQKVPAWLSIIIVAKDIIISIGWCLLLIVYDRADINPTFLGKSSTALQFLTVCVIILLPPSLADYSGLSPLDGLIYITGLFTILALLHYLYVGMLIPTQASGNKDRWEGRTVDS